MNRFQQYNRARAIAKHNAFRFSDAEAAMYDACDNASRSVEAFGIAAARMMHMLSRQPLTEEIKRDIQAGIYAHRGR